MTPGVTIGIPLFNGARFLRRTIESLLAQTRTDFTLTVFDDRSTDDSVAIARSFDDPRLRVEVNPVRRGLGGNWNAVLERASTPYAVIAHQDDVYEPHYLETVVALLESQPRAFIAHTRATYIDEHERALGSVASRYKDAFWPRDEPAMREPREELRVLQQGNYIICPSAIYRMSAVARIGPFDESLRFVTDWDYWLRGLMAGFTIAGTHARLICWRRHSSSATVDAETTLRRYDEELALLDRLARTAGLPRKTGLVAKTLLSEFAARLARGDRAGAEALRQYARSHLPESRALTAAMSIGARGGRAAGHAMLAAQALYTRFARVSSRA